MNRWWVVILILLASCVDPVETPTDCIAAVTWQPPSQTLDGSPLTVEELRKFTVFLSSQPDTDDIFKQLQVDITNTYLITWEIKNIPEGAYYYYMTATDLEGNVSAYSNILFKEC
jgi:hypothetical protein